MHVVVFPGWYPNKNDEFSGDFIQRHMQAIALYCRVTVIFPVKRNGISKPQVTTNTTGNLTEIVHYYPAISANKTVDALVSFLRYNYFALKHFTNARRQQKVNLVQLYVLQKNHWLGWLCKALGVPFYVVSEQSTAYVDGHYEQLPGLHKFLTRSVFRQARARHAVSNFLANAIQQKLHLNSSKVIGNVVNASLFTYEPAQSNTTRFVHVSNMTYQKNIDGMLRALAALKINNYSFILNLVGPVTQAQLQLIDALQLQQHVVVWYEQPYEQVAAIMKQSDAFIFFTRFETFGCVIIEANACGLPVIITDLPVTRELVADGVNGIFVENEDEDDLADKLAWYVDNSNSFNRSIIAATTHNRFNYKTIGKQFYDWFNALRNDEESG